MNKVMPEELHMMVDLETLGTGLNSAITQLGWCLFQPCAEQWNVKSGVYNIDPQSCVDAGLTMEWGAIQWWMRQSDDARAHFNVDGTLYLKDALHSFYQGTWSNIKGVWSHGAGFDLPILENAFKRVKMRAPWHYKAARDTRTLFWLAPETVWPDNPVKHDAQQDAIAQAGAVVDALRKIGAATITKKEETIDQSTPTA